MLFRSSNITETTTSVVHIKKHLVPSYYLINNKYKVTGEHFIFTKRDNTWQFLRVEELINNDIFYGINKEELVEVIDLINSPILVVDIDVEENDLYFADGILVHNAKQVPGGA